MTRGVKEWRDVKGYEGLYQVSNMGNVRRIQRGQKFSADKIRKAKLMFKEGKTAQAVAAFLGASISLVNNIKYGKAWTGNPSYRTLKPQADKQKYLYVRLSKKSVITTKYIHRLVWETFEGPIPDDCYIVFKNDKRSIVRLDNLRLITKTESWEVQGDTRKGYFMD